MDQGQESGKRRLTFGQWGRLVLFALTVTLLVSAVAAETGPEPVDFYCGSLAAARSTGDPETLDALVEAGYCKHFVSDHGFQAFGELEYIETIEGTDKTIWLVHFGNGTWVYTVR